MKICLYNLLFAVLGGGERRTARLAAHLARRHDVSLLVKAPLDTDQVRTHFGIDLSGVRVIDLGDRDHCEAIRALAPDVFINNSYASDLQCPVPGGVYMCMFPEPEQADLKSYSVVTANSAYVARWIKRSWGRDAEVVHSACELIGLAAEPKKQTILNVGRFFGDPQDPFYKGQDTLVAAFRAMVDGGLTGWELKLVGKVGPGPFEQTLIGDLRRVAAGYPIRICPDLDFSELRRAYQDAAIYWHGMGFGLDPLLQPSRQEHFGMTIVEAMSAGAVPMVFNGGGPRDTVVAGSTGFVWNDPDELVTQTRWLIDHPEARRSMAIRAVMRSRRFAANVFLSRMDRIVARLGAEPVTR